MPVIEAVNDIIARAVSGAAGVGDVNGVPPTISDPSSMPGYYQSTGPRTAVSIWILGGISLVFLLLRLYCKWLKHRGLYWDDYVLIAGWLAALATIILTTISIAHGYGRHYWAVPDSSAYVLRLTGLMSVTFANTGQAWSKTSFALTLYRISEPWMKKLIWVIIISVNVVQMLSSLFFWIPCKPLEKAWSPLIEGTCWNPYISVDFYIVAACFSGIMDLTLALLPWKIVMSLQMKTTEKFGVAVAMSMGIFAATSAFIKASYGKSMAVVDFNYVGYHLVIWGIAETAVTVMAASIPVMRVLLREVSTTGGSGGGYNRTDPENNQHSQRSMGTSANAYSNTNKRRSSLSNAVSVFTSPKSTKQTEVYGMTNISERSLPSSVSTMPLHPAQQQNVKEM